MDTPDTPGRKALQTECVRYIDILGRALAEGRLIEALGALEILKTITKTLLTRKD